MKSNKLAPKKNTAQAMVEFAIVLPILLLLLYGLLEAGRLLFIYSTVVNASRQAARYGSATGVGTGTALRYQDCAGIKFAAQRVDYLNSFNDDNILITYDNGEGVAADFSPPTCDGAVDPDVRPSTDNTTRIVVTVTGHFVPIVRLVPFIERDIVATSARTILMSVPIEVEDEDAPETPTIEIEDLPDPSKVGETVPVKVTVSGTSGTPTGTVDISVDGTPITGCTGLTLSGGVVTCPIIFNLPGTVTISATYTPATGTTDYESETGTEVHQVDPVPTTVVIEDTPAISGINLPVNILVRVIGDFGTTPTGTVNVTVSEGVGDCNGPHTLTGGTFSCTMTFSAPGFPNISADYVGDPVAGFLPDVGSKTHEVRTDPPTAIPPTAIPPTAIPPTAIPTTPVPPTLVPTVAPTQVSNCNSIKDSAGSIQVVALAKTMSLTFNNQNPYAVTIQNIYVAWNYDNGHKGSIDDLNLVSARLNTTTFWTGDVNDEGFWVPISTPLIIPANTTTNRITFTFNQTYDRAKGDKIQISFSTPGCESYPIIVPVGAATPIPPTPMPSANLKVQYRAADVTVGDNQIKPDFNIVNLGTGAVPLSELKIRYWYTREGTANQEFWCDLAATLGSCSNVTGTFVQVNPARTGADFYLEVGFTAAAGAVSAGGQTGEIQTRFNKTDSSNYTETGDYSFDPTKPRPSFADWTHVTLYRNGILIWGIEP
ncbi:MAG: hypothetical protein EHM33_11610 [Chloroflexi bacterium]|nr:MAG: hypothetical protein EHM33_11610 [Chloroflexota bacterium]